MFLLLGFKFLTKIGIKKVECTASSLISTTGVAREVGPSQKILDHFGLQ